MPNVSYRKLEKRDLPDRVRWFNKIEVSRYLNADARKGTTLKKQQEWYARFIKKDDILMYTIESDGKPVGNVALTDISKTDSNAGIFIAINCDYYGKGIGMKAIQFILDLGFNELNLHKIWLYVCAENVPAINLYKKCGFKEEGRLKDMWNVDGKYYDEIVMAIFNPKDND